MTGGNNQDVMIITSSLSYNQRQLTEPWNVKPGHIHVCESACHV